MRAANRVALNTFVQYVQLVLNVLVGLYSVRLILSALGASDYGLYDVIAGTVSMLSFISVSMSQTSIRFLSVSLGSSDEVEIRQTFSTCFWLHCAIALILALVLSIAGVFLFDGFLNIPEGRVGVARVLYYFMIFNLFLSIVTTPFSALVASHEHFIYLCLVSILNVLLKLGIAILITYTSQDRLMLYGILMVCITFVDLLLNGGYAIARFGRQISLKLSMATRMRKMTGFAGWTLMDVMGTVATRQGYALLFNIFFGTIINAVFTLSRQIEGHIYTISASVINTMKPQIMKSFGAGNIPRMFRLSMTAGKFGFSMMALVAIPLMVMMPEVLRLWLKDVPEGTVLFSRIMILACMCEQLTRGLVYANQAVGNIKWFSIIISSIRILSLPVSWLLFLLGFPASAAMYVFLVCETLGSLSRIIVLARISDFRPADFFRTVFIHILPPFIISYLICFCLYRYFSGIWGMLAVTAITCSVYAIIMYLIGLTEEERASVSGIIRTVLKR